MVLFIGNRDLTFAHHIIYSRAMSQAWLGLADGIITMGMGGGRKKNRYSNRMCKFFRYIFSHLSTSNIWKIPIRQINRHPIQIENIQQEKE